MRNSHYSHYVSQWLVINRNVLNLANCLEFTSMNILSGTITSSTWYCKIYLGPVAIKKRRLSAFLANRVSCLYFIIPSQIITCESRVTFTCLRNYVNFTRVNIIGAMSGRFRSTCTFSHGLSHSGSIIFTRVKFTYART